MPKRWPQTVLLALTAAVAACSTTDQAEGADEVEPPCPCIPVSDEDARLGEDVAIPDCEAALCPTIIGKWELDAQAFDNPETIDCALEALRDGTPGVIQWTAQNCCGESSGYILIEDDGTLVTRTWGPQDLAWVAKDSIRGQPKPASEFEACLADPDPSVRFECVLTARASKDLVCDAGWIIDVL